MRIALIHSFYTSRRPSGENVMVNLQAEALAKAGYEVKLIARYTDELRNGNPLYPLKAGFDVSTGLGYDPTEELLDFKPDVVWVHNLFPNFSTKWLAKWQGPLIATLYNYRPVCANGVLFREGAVCTLCPDGKPLSALKFGCYRDSRIASVPLTIQISKGLDDNPLIARADKIVLLSDDSKNAYQRFGLHPDKVVVLPTYVQTSEHIRRSPLNDGKWVVASRLSPEKGVKKLVEQWPDGLELDIYGDGEERPAIEAMGRPNVRLMGQVSSGDLAKALPSYVGMVFPSLVWETQGLAAGEALHRGLAVVARMGTSVARLISKYRLGAIYGDDQDDLLTALNSALVMPRDLDQVEEAFPTETIWIDRAETLLRSVVNSDPTVAIKPQPMRIALIHSFYTSRRPSGENVMVNLQAEALAKAGYEVKLIARYTDELRNGNPLYPLKAGIDVSTGLGYDPTEELLDFKPDVVWVHNLFPNFSTRWLTKWRGPLIATLYNYRSVCANGVLFRDGHVCTLCPDGKPLSALKFGCYRDSRIASVPLTIQISKGLDDNPLIARADKIVVLSPRAFEIFSALGVREDRMDLIPTFVKDTGSSGAHTYDEKRWVAAGRWGDEKGLRSLLEKWPSDVSIDIYGQGPNFNKLIREFVSPNIVFRGHIEQDRFVAELPNYAGLVFPSIWPETQGAVVCEAFAAGLPAVAREGSAGADWVAKHSAGVVYGNNGTHLEVALETVASRRSELSINARAAFESDFTEQGWIAQVAGLFESLVGPRIG